MKSIKWNPEKLVAGFILTSLFLLLSAVTIYIIWTSRETNVMGWPFILFLLLFAIGLPFFLTFGVFSVYRYTYANQYPERVHQVDWNGYIIQMLTLITVIVVIVATLIWRDSEASRYFPEHTESAVTILPSLVLGRGSFPLYFSMGSPNKPIFFPTAMFWWAYLGAITNIIQTILRRFSKGHLVAKSYLNSSLRLIQSMIAAALIFVAFQVWPGQFNQSASSILNRWQILVLLAFLAGIFPDIIIHWVTARVRAWLKIGGRKFIPLTEIQGIDLGYTTLLNDEGIWSVYDLATCNPESLAGKLHMESDTTRYWKQQARLLTSMGEAQTVDVSA